MKLSQSFKLAAAIKPKTVNSIVLRREKLSRAIDKQLYLINQNQIGNKSNGLWHWQDETGSFFLPIKYGKKVIELSKGKYAIHCESLDEVIRSLITMKDIINSGEMDNALKLVSEKLRANFIS